MTYLDTYPVPTNFAAFKAYDVRGKIDHEITDAFVYHLGRALVVYLQAQTVVLGADVRQTSPHFKAILARAIQDQGADVIDLGQTGTEQIYHAVSHLDADAGVQVTASHNPLDYNGFKIVGKHSVALSADSGLNEIKALMQTGVYPDPQASTKDSPKASPTTKTSGSYTQLDLTQAYLDKLFSFIKPLATAGKDSETAGTPTPSTTPKLRILLNSGNGAAGPIAQQVAKRLEAFYPVECVQFLDNPDPLFPNGIPNPLLTQNRALTTQAVLKHQAQLGVAFDGDFDRCFFFDHEGNFVDGYYLCGLLSQAFLAHNPEATIVYEPRLLWNTLEVIKQGKGTPVLSKSGHSFIKAKMRQHSGIYGGELSAHHYFRDFYFCDSGMIPWLLVVQLLLTTGQSLAELVAQMRQAYPCSDELNFKLGSADSVAAVFNQLEQTFTAGLEPEKAQATTNSSETPVAVGKYRKTTIDGLSLEFNNWRFNVRCSNTEPLLRVNLETRQDPELVQAKVAQITQLITALS